MALACSHRHCSPTLLLAQWAACSLLDRPAYFSPPRFPLLRLCSSLLVLSVPSSDVTSSREPSQRLWLSASSGFPQMGEAVLPSCLHRQPGKSGITGTRSPAPGPGHGQCRGVGADSGLSSGRQERPGAIAHKSHANRRGNLGPERGGSGPGYAGRRTPVLNQLRLVAQRCVAKIKAPGAPRRHPSKPQLPRGLAHPGPQTARLAGKRELELASVGGTGKRRVSKR